MNNQKTTQKTIFALFFGNRGFFPASLIAGAREEMTRELHALGHETIMLDTESTRYGAIETPREGEVFANFLRNNRGKFGGVIVCLPNFGDETGAVAALQEAGVPIWIQAYPDDFDKMGPALRRDSFCGKISIMDVFRQYGVKFTAMKPHTVRPGTPLFTENLQEFDRVCQVVNGVRGMVIGAVGARTTPFKTVRIDEVTLQRHGVTVETFDLSDIFLRMNAVKTGNKYSNKSHELLSFATWEGVPEKAQDHLVRLGVVLDDLAEEANIDAFAIRCWTEMQLQMGISPCVVMGILNESRLASACEVDLGNAVAMHALGLASYQPVALMDWNNNYGEEEEDKCILFHCGPAPASMMIGQGKVSDHAILMNAVGEGNAFGCNTGRLKPTKFTFGSLMTDEGKIKMYLGEGQITPDPIPENFFGVAGVAEIDRLQDVLLHIGVNGHRHHVSITHGQVQASVSEALGHYLNFEIAHPQRQC